MKTTFKSLFADFQDDLMDIREETVCDDTDVRTEAVMQKALAAVNARKPHRRKGKILLIAAVIAVIVGISTTMIFAGGELQIAFEEFFGGNMNAAGLYDGGNVQIKTADPNLDVSFLGITGDEHEMFAVLKAENKDGTCLTEEGYAFPITSVNGEDYNAYLHSIEGRADVEPDEVISRLSGFGGIRAICKDRHGNNFGYGEDGEAEILSYYYLSEDRKTLKILINLNMDSASGTKHLDARDGTMTIQSSSFTAQKIIRTVMTSPQLDAESYDAYRKKLEELHLQESDCTILCTEDEALFCQVERKEVALPFEVTFTMNFRYNGNIKRTLWASDVPHFIQKGTTNVQMTISPFSIRIKGEKDVKTVNENPGHFVCFENIDLDHSKVIMKDGTVYYFENRGQSGGGGIYTGVKTTYHLQYALDPHNTLDTERLLIDTRQIEQIILNGDVVYHS